MTGGMSFMADTGERVLVQNHGRTRRRRVVIHVYARTLAGGLYPYVMACGYRSSTVEPATDRQAPECVTCQTRTRGGVQMPLMP